MQNSFDIIKRAGVCQISPRCKTIVKPSKRFIYNSFPIISKNLFGVSGKMSSKLLRLRRFLYTGNEDALYRTGNPVMLRLYYRSKLGVVSEILKTNDVEMILSEVKVANDWGCLPRPETVFFVLAVALRCTRNFERRRRILTTMKNTCRTVKDLYKYINFHIKCGGRFGVGLKNVIKEYFIQKEPIALAIEITNEDGCEGWEHKDIINISRIEAKRRATKVVLEYATKGLDSAIACATGDPDSEEIIERFRQIEELENCDNADRVADLIKALRCDLSMAPTGFHRNPQVWAAVVSVMPTRELLSCLPQLLHLNVLKSGSHLEETISEYLVAEEIIEASCIEPLEVLIVLTHFDIGKEEVDVNDLADDDDDEDDDKEGLPTFFNIINALYTMLNIIIQHRQPINKRFMITIEMTDKMDYLCLNQEHITCLDAAAVILTALIKLEPNVIIGIFNGSSIDYLEILQNEKPVAILSTLNRFKSSFVMPSAIFQSAIHKQECVDVFINLMSDFEWITTIPEELADAGPLDPLDSLERYRREMSLPNAKLISFSLSSPEWRIGRNKSGVLDVYGLNAEIMRVIKAFANELFC